MIDIATKGLFMTNPVGNIPGANPSEESPQAKAGATYIANIMKEVGKINIDVQNGTMTGKSAQSALSTVIATVIATGVSLGVFKSSSNPELEEFQHDAQALGSQTDAKGTLVQLMGITSTILLTGMGDASTPNGDYKCVLESKFNYKKCIS